MNNRSWLVLIAAAILISLVAACGPAGGSPAPAGPTVPAKAATPGGAAAPAVTAAPVKAATPGGTAAPAATPAAAGAGGPIRIGSKNFTEQLILGEMYAQLLESNGFRVERKLNLGGTAVAHEAVRTGNIDLYPEYTGTGLLAILQLPTQSDPNAVFQTVSQQYKDKWNLVWLDQAPMNNSQALAVKQELSQQRNMTTISQMVQIAPQLVLAAVPDFPEREDGLAGLKKVYGDFQFKEIKIFDPGIKYRAFLDGQADVVVAFGTDGQIGGYNLVELKDDKGLWPPYHVAPVVRQETLDGNANLAPALNKLAPLLTSEVMRDLNWRVDGPDKQEPAKVAGDFLKQMGLVK